MKHAKRLAVSALAGAAVLFGFWLGGFDFNDRGGLAVTAYIVANYTILLVYFFPGWN